MKSSTPDDFKTWPQDRRDAYIEQLRKTKDRLFIALLICVVFLILFTGLIVMLGNLVK